jgi:GH18 family chitinase
MRAITYRYLLLLTAIFFCADAVAQNNKEIVGYYPNWQWYDRNHLVNPESIMYEKYTIINYAFFRPMADGSVVSTDSWADENLLLGPMIWWPVVMHDSTKSLPYQAHQAGVKLLPSIGGWNDSYNFPAIAANTVKRQTFVNSCLALIDVNNFDGVDLDWEYPGYAPNGGTTQDKQNFTLLLQDMRNGLDALELQTGKDYLLTSCFSPDGEKMLDIEWPDVLPLVDMVNFMTYDFHGSWDPESNHNTPMYPPQIGNPDWCIDGAFTILTQTFNVPPEKVNVGMAFYGKSLANCSQLYGPHTGYDGSTFWEDEGVPLYYNILKKMNQFTRYWDDEVKCPYLLGNAINTFVTYDDPESLRYKAQFVEDHNAKGIIIWEITGDYIETDPGSGIIAGTPLLDTIHVVFNESGGQNNLTFNLKEYLEGPFNGTEMTTLLNSGGYLPLSQPYNSSPWNYPGTENVGSIPNNNVVDWVLVELRDASSAPLATAATRIARQAGFLLKNGQIVGLNGSSPLQFTVIVDHQLFAVVWYRNHLGVMSSSGLVNVGGTYSYDFTTGSGQVYGGASAHKQVGTEIWGMMSGDGDGNGTVNLNDKTLIWALKAGKTGYFTSDFNLDRQTNNKDKNEKWWPNLNKSTMVP